MMVKHFGWLVLCLSLVACDTARMEVLGKGRNPNRKLDCGIQSLLTVYQDLNGDQVYGFQEVTGVVMPYSGSMSAIGYYASSGLLGEDRTITAYFYSGPDGLSFNFLIDRDPKQKSIVEVSVLNNLTKERTLFTTDGGIVGPLAGGDFEVHFQTLSAGNLNRSVIHTPRGEFVENRKIGPASLNFMVRYADVDPCLL